MKMYPELSNGSRRLRTLPVTRSGPHFNALTHGLRSGHVLLPGDDVAAFRKLRHRLFHLHKPRTIAEALHVETLATSEWRMARCRLEQSFFKHHLGAAMSGHPNASGYLCSPDLHRLHHRGTDCEREERGLAKSKARSETTLAQLQKQRTENLTFGLAEVLEDYQVFLEEGEPVVEELEAETAPEDAAGTKATEEAASGDAAEADASDSDDGGISNGRKRTPDASAPRFPKRWNRRQRRAAGRRRPSG